MAYLTPEINAEAAINRYYELKKNFPDQYYFVPRPIVRIANWLIGKERITDAIKLFELCVDEYPDSPEGYNGLGESYLKLGNRES